MTFVNKIASATLAIAFIGPAVAAETENTTVQTPQPRILQASEPKCWERQALFSKTQNCLGLAIVERYELDVAGSSGSARLKFLINTYAVSTLCTHTPSQSSCEVVSLPLSSREPQ
jgi:hypothetical protein